MPLLALLLLFAAPAKKTPMCPREAFSGTEVGTSFSSKDAAISDAKKRASARCKNVKLESPACSVSKGAKAVHACRVPWTCPFAQVPCAAKR